MICLVGNLEVNRGAGPALRTFPELRELHSKYTLRQIAHDI